MNNLQGLLEKSASLHHHLCPRQVLGIRMGLYAGEILGLDLPQVDKRLYTISETDGCGVDGISVATNCWVGRRTLRIEDYGKVAATFVDSITGKSVRIVPRSGVRNLALEYATASVSNRWEGQLIGYQYVPSDLLFDFQFVRLVRSIEEILSRPKMRTVCDVCGEEILNQREIIVGTTTFCKACAGQSYYQQEITENAIPMEYIFH